MHNEFTEYIFERIKKDDYRGIHLSQHNRLPFEKVLTILKVIYQIARNTEFNIHIGDWKGVQQENCTTYYAIVDALKQEIKQCTVNSLKKNIFPDLNKMGFLLRYSKSHQIVGNDKREHIHSVQLTERSIKIINELQPRQQYRMYIESTEKLLEPILDELFYILYTKIETVSIYEYMYIISDNNLKTEEKIHLIKIYRKLKKIEQIKITRSIKQEFININLSAKNKRYKRDFGNWYNECLQIFNLLNQTIYFKTFRKTVLMLSISQEALEFITTRSQSQKEEYFKWHNIQRNEQYHLHHIVPLSFSTNKKELEIIDNFKNLIYILNKTHSKIPSDYIQLVFENNKIILVNPLDSKESIDITNDVIVNIKHLKEMVHYNQLLLNTIK